LSNLPVQGGRNVATHAADGKDFFKGLATHPGTPFF
jgi:hypothetical protein